MVGKRRRDSDDPEDFDEFQYEQSPEPYDEADDDPHIASSSRGRKVPLASRPVRFDDMDDDMNDDIDADADIESESDEDEALVARLGSGKSRNDMDRMRIDEPSDDLEEIREVSRHEDNFEVDETDDLLNFGEPPLSDEEEEALEKTIPTRRLTNFTIFDPSDENKLLTLFDLEEENEELIEFIARGIVEPIWEDAEDDELYESPNQGDEPLRHPEAINARLTKILSISAEPDSPKIWIRTAHAWYELGSPSKTYEPYYRNYWIRWCLVYLICDAIRKSDDDEEEPDPPTTWSDFIKSLHHSRSGPEEAAEARRVLGRPLRSEDFFAYRDYILQEILHFRENPTGEETFDFDSSHPIFHVIKTGEIPSPTSASVSREPRRMVQSKNSTEAEGQTRDSESPAPVPRELSRAQTRKRRRPRRPIGRTRRRDIETQVLRDRNLTYVTPRVGANAKYFFSRELMRGYSDLSESSEDEQNTFEATFSIKELRLDESDADDDNSSPSPSPSPTQYLSRGEQMKECARIKPKMRWMRTKGTPSGYHKVEKRTDYDKILIDSVKYKIGDFVVISIDCVRDENPKRRNAWNKPGSRSSNELANQYWFAEIVELFEEKKSTDKLAHVRWYDHGSKTLLQEAHHPREIFPINQCVHCLDCSLIAGKCVVTRCDASDDPPRYEKGTPNNHLFYRRRWEISTCSFHDLDPPLEELRRNAKAIACMPCHLEDIQKRNRQYRFSDSRNAIHWADRVYHQFDHAFINPEDEDKHVYDIIQILDLEPGRSGKIRVAWYARHSQIPDVERKEAHRLYRLGREEIIPIHLLAGPCQVEHVSTLTNNDDMRSIKSDPEAFYVSEIFLRDEEARSINDLENLDKKDFLSCNVCKVERETARQAFQSFKKDRVLDLFCGGGGFSQGFSNSGYADAKWGVDFSPAACETFKGKHPNAIVYNQCLNLVLEEAVKATKTRNYRPHLESIADDEPLPPFPRRGEVDLILAGPQCTGYSGLNRFKSASDVRNTLIAVTMAYVEHLLPSRVVIENVGNMATFPLRGKEVDGKVIGGVEWGTHKFILRTFLDLGYQVRSAVLQAGDYGTPQLRKRLIYFAARSGQSLPDFPLPTHCFQMRPQHMKLPTWGNAPIPARRDRWYPHYPITARDAIGDLPVFDWFDPSKTLEKRDGVSTFNASLDKRFCGYSSSRHYTTPPLCDYQEWLRGSKEKVSLNHTVIFDKNTTSRVCNIPARKDADHRSLPKSLEVRTFMGSTGAAAKNRLYPGMYGRVSWDGPFQTVVSRINPGHKQGRILHPDQRRVLSVREYARSQGFSDDTEFISPSGNENDLYRIIGNALPIPLGMALARSVGLAAMTDQQRQGQLRRRRNPV